MPQLHERTAAESSCSNAVAMRSISSRPMPHSAAAARQVRTCCTDFGGDRSSHRFGEKKLARNAHRELDGCDRIAIDVDRRRELARFHVRRYGVEIIRRRQVPSAAVVQDGVISQVIIEMRRQDVERESPPEGRVCR